MSGQEDFGPLLEALVTCVGVVDVISLFAYMFHRTNAKELSPDINNNDARSALGVVRDKSPIANAARSIPKVLVEGEAPLVKPDGDVIDSLVSKVNELEAKVTELEAKSREGSMESFIEMERYRRSRTPSPYPSAALKDDESSSFDGETNTSSSDSRAGSARHPSKLITRDDEFRKTIKRSSQISHESREEELMEFSMLERQESENMDDYVHITYEGQDDAHYRHGISPIQEVPSCPIHGDIERSPEPGMSSMTDKPWGDIKKDAAGIRKQEKRDQLRRSLSIDEQPAAEERAARSENVTKSPVPAVDVNENFIKMERSEVQQSSKMLVKQAHVGSDDQPEESTVELVAGPLPVVEIINAPTSVESSLTEIDLTREILQNSSPTVAEDVSFESLF